MNDPQYVEAARGLAERTLRDGGPQDESRVAYLFRLCTARPPTAVEANEILQLVADRRTHYQADTDAAARLIAIGQSQADDALDVAELAAWTVAGNLMLNLDEVVSKN